ncbi:BTAD domain-containing putative transcriptional regulator [Dactylosporangium sp. CA-139066]|uniref:BTAD domain-containing putative transcriptional regulator n=1 Tax=Dactylosporangium sp. CA-139066 TaxID=3239930 RepID=UPI003D93CAEE
MLMRVLGPFEAEVGRDGPVDIGGRRQRAVLARLLAARGDVVSVDRMIDDLWRGEPPPRAIASLQVYVSNLRRFLEPDRERRAPARLLVSAPPGYAIRLPSDAVDAWRFEQLLADARAASRDDPRRAVAQLRAALRLWRGDAYAEFAGESWAQPEAVRLEELRFAARELLLDVALRTGAAAEAVAEAELLTRQAPLREETWRLLALALWSTGRQADALAALRRARTVLAEELGLDPGRPLLDLESAILSGREDLLPALGGPSAGSARGSIAAARSDMSGAGAPDISDISYLRGWSASASRDDDQGPRGAGSSADAGRNPGMDRAEAGGGPVAGIGGTGASRNADAAAGARTGNGDAAARAGTGGADAAARAGASGADAAARAGAGGADAAARAGTGGGDAAARAGAGGADAAARAGAGGADAAGRAEIGGEGASGGVDPAVRAGIGGGSDASRGADGEVRAGSGQTGLSHEATPAAGETRISYKSEMSGAPAPDISDRNTISGGADHFVGRSDELAALLAAAADRPQVVLITGEAGVGKTSLLRRFRKELAAQGWLVAVGRCPEVEGAPPAWAWVEALRRLAAEVPPGELSAALRPLLEEDPGEEREDAAAGRFRLHRAVVGWLRSAAENHRPVAIVLDDLHAADGETLMLLAAVAELVERGGPPLLIVGALRPADNRERLAATMAALARRSPVRVALDGLAGADVAQLIRAFVGGAVDEETVAALTERTGGNPFYVRESAQLLASEGALVATSEVPEGVRDVLRRRLSRLPQPAVAVLRLAAVVGREADVETLVEAADTDENGVLDALEAGLIAGLLTEPAPGRVRFVHGLVRDTMYTDLAQLRRTRMHARVAASTRRLRPDDYPALAHHYARAASSETAALAVDYAVRAAELAERRYAYDAAIEALQGALPAAEVLPGDRDAMLIDLLGRLLRAQARAGAVAAARRTRDRAVDVAVASGRDELLVAAFTAWTVATPWQIRQYAIRDERIIGLLSGLLRRDDLDPEDRCRLLDALNNELDGEGDPAGVAAGIEALEIARAVGDPRLLALALTARARTLSFDRDGDVERREQIAIELQGLAERHGLVSYRWMADQILGNCAAATNRPDDVAAAVSRQVSLARAYHLAEAFAINLANQAALAHVEGDFARAQALYDECREQLRRQGSIHADSFHFLATVTLEISQGRAGRIVELARAGRDSLGPIGDDAYAFALAADGQLDAARAVPIGEYPIRPDYFESGLYTVRGLAVVALGRADLAQAVIDALMPVRTQLAGFSSTSIAMQPVALTLGELFRLQGRAEEATVHFQLAADVATRWNAPHWLAAAKSALAA